MTARTRVFKHSARDAVLVLLSLLNLALLVYGVWSFGRIPLWGSLGIVLMLCFLVTTNYQCVAHNFLHNAFFSAPWLNRLFSVVNTLVLGLSQTFYKYHHLHHHRYNNDARDPNTGTTRDRTSTWRHSRRPDREENIFSYSFLGIFRQDYGFLLQDAHRRGHVRFIVIETVAWIALVVALGWLNWRGLLWVFMPSWYLGQCAALWENYLEHHGAIPGDRKTDSVSCYGRLYNLIWFNNGYHQEHHLKPQVHWTEIESIRKQLPPETHRRVCKGAHWFNFFPPPLSAYPLGGSAGANAEVSRARSAAL